jgi:uncharacterized protein
LTCDGRLPLDEQLARFELTLRRNRTLTEVLDRAATLDLPGWYLVAGCLCQTVWNVVSGQPPEAGILDYDLAYFDAADLSWNAEDAVIRTGHQLFARLPGPVQIRNQARVHLWYEEKFGTACPPRPGSARPRPNAGGASGPPSPSCPGLACDRVSREPVSRSRQPRSQGASSPILA